METVQAWALILLVSPRARWICTKCSQLGRGL